MIEAIRFSETAVLTRATRRDVQEDGILHSHRHDNLNSYPELHVSSVEKKYSRRTHFCFQVQRLAQYEQYFQSILCESHRDHTDHENISRAAAKARQVGDFPS
jgi:hypothetical protein